MKREHRTVTMTWQDADTGGVNRVTLRLRRLQIGAGAVLAGMLLAVVSGAVATQLQRQSAQLHASRSALVQERDQLALELEEARREMEQARSSLALVRTEEARIRSWLGLEASPGVEETLLSGDQRVGGKGSPGDEGLETVAPEARSAEAEDFVVGPNPGLVAESRALAEDLADLAVYVEKQKEGWDAIPAVSPVDGDHWISSAFGWRASPFTGKREFHSGLDMAGREGTPVVAAANGQVDQVFNDRALGRGLSIDHGNGIRTIYGHLEKVLVSQGERVTRGHRVGLMGSSGKRSTGPHLHYALKVDGQYVNPRNYLLDRSRPAIEVAKK